MPRERSNVRPSTMTYRASVSRTPANGAFAGVKKQPRSCLPSPGSIEVELGISVRLHFSFIFSRVCRKQVCISYLISRLPYQSHQNKQTYITMSKAKAQKGGDNPPTPIHLRSYPHHECSRLLPFQGARDATNGWSG